MTYRHQPPRPLERPHWAAQPRTSSRVTACATQPRCKCSKSMLRMQRPLFVVASTVTVNNACIGRTSQRSHFLRGIRATVPRATVRTGVSTCATPFCCAHGGADLHDVTGPGCAH
eukprot:14094341-Alexandrium_andersonii.AAC.1